MVNQVGEVILTRGEVACCLAPNQTPDSHQSEY